MNTLQLATWNYVLRQNTSHLTTSLWNTVAVTGTNTTYMRKSVRKFNEICGSTRSVNKTHVHNIRNNKARSRNHSYRGKATITHFKYVSLTLIIRHVEHMCRIILSSVACLDLPHFFALSHKRHDFRGGGGGGVNEKNKLFCLNFLTKI
jgi:hypothetical protein